MATYRLYIDETGDHRYRYLDEPGGRYLGLTGVLIRQAYYAETVPQALESLKKEFFKYDPDRPPILVRSQIVYRKHAFGVLVDRKQNTRWENALAEFFEKLKAQIFTVVMDKKVHKQRYPLQTFDAYMYSMAVLLWRVRGFMHIYGETADIMAEARGKKEDAMIQSAYEALREYGFTGYGTASGYVLAYPEAKIVFGTKRENVAGLQVADLIAYGQKLLTLEEYGRPYHKPMTSFTRRLNDSVSRKVNQYGRYLLE